MYTINPCHLLAKIPVRPRLSSVAAILAIGLLLAASSARADLFNLTSDHCSGGCGPQTSFGTVELTQVGANVNVTVSLLNGNQFIETGSGAMMNFLFDDAAITLTDSGGSFALPAATVRLMPLPALSRSLLPTRRLPKWK